MQGPADGVSVPSYPLQLTPLAPIIAPSIPPTLPHPLNLPHPLPLRHTPLRRELDCAGAQTPDQSGPAGREQCSNCRTQTEEGGRGWRGEGRGKGREGELTLGTNQFQPLSAKRVRTSVDYDHGCNSEGSKATFSACLLR